jgi:hypothetical protein
LEEDPFLNDELDEQLFKETLTSFIQYLAKLVVCDVVNGQNGGCNRRGANQREREPSEESAHAFRLDSLCTKMIRRELIRIISFSMLNWRWMDQNNQFLDAQLEVDGSESSVLDAQLGVDFTAINIKAMRAHGRLSSMPSFAKSVANRLLLGSG